MNQETLLLVNLANELEQILVKLLSKPVNQIGTKDKRTLQRVKISLANTSNRLGNYIYEGGENLPENLDTTTT